MHKKLNTNFLIPRYMRPAEKEIIKEYRTTPNGHAIYIGQINEEGKPSGIVRKITKQGYIYEGYMTEDYKFNGFVVRYSGPGTWIDAGWMSNNSWEGNVISGGLTIGSKIL